MATIPGHLFGAGLVAGDSASFLVQDAGCSAAEGWVLHVRLTPLQHGGAAIQLTGVAEGSEHRLAWDSDDSANWPAGEYSWAAWMARGTERRTRAQGHTVVAPNPFTLPVGTDTRSLARRALADAQAAFAAWKPTQRKYQIGDVMREFNEASEIITVIRYWETQVAKEDGAAGRSSAPRRRRIGSRL